MVNSNLLFFSLKERDKAARIIQSVVLNFLTRRRLWKKANAALVMQKCWRRISAQRKLLMLKHEKLAKLQSKSASLIQVWYSGIIYKLKTSSCFFLSLEGNMWQNFQWPSLEMSLGVSGWIGPGTPCRCPHLEIFSCNFCASSHIVQTIQSFFIGPSTV